MNYRLDQLLAYYQSIFHIDYAKQSFASTSLASALAQSDATFWNMNLGFFSNLMRAYHQNYRCCTRIYSYKAFRHPSRI